LALKTPVEKMLWFGFGIEMWKVSPNLNTFLTMFVFQKKFYYIPWKFS